MAELSPYGVRASAGSLRASDGVVHGVAVVADGGFDQAWASTGIRYQAEVDSPADASDVRRLLDVVDEVAEIPRAVRAGAEVTRR